MILSIYKWNFYANCIIQYHIEKNIVGIYMRIAVVGATGMVGRMFLKVLEERQFPVDEYVLFASKRSAGNVIEFMVHYISYCVYS